jgi:hypothetical protein
MSLDLQAMTGGFADPPVQSARAFRADSTRCRGPG